MKLAETQNVLDVRSRIPYGGVKKAAVISATGLASLFIKLWWADSVMVPTS